MDKKTKKSVIALISLVIIILVSLGVITDHTSVTPGMYKVVDIVDGDTIKVMDEKDELTVRMIGINTPETVDPRRPVECFGKEASLRTTDILKDQEVRLEYDDTQGRRDKYNRTLAYVLLADGTNVNKKLIEEGYAYEYTYEHPYIYQSEFKLAQQDAENNKRGLWAEGVCQ